MSDLIALLLVGFTMLAIAFLIFFYIVPKYGMPL